MDSQILSLYAKGMTTREIVDTFKEMYDADVSPTLISKVTDAVKEQGKIDLWMHCISLFIFACIIVKVRHGGSVINKVVFLALGINTEGQKELLGMWLAENDGAKSWLSVLTELKNRDASGYPDCLRGWAEGLPVCDKQRLSSDAHPVVVHHPYGARQSEIRVVEGLQSRHRRAESSVSGSDRGSRADGAGYVRECLRR